jgi:hypothetical protein
MLWSQLARLPCDRPRLAPEVRLGLVGLQHGSRLTIVEDDQKRLSGMFAGGVSR